MTTPNDAQWSTLSKVIQSFIQRPDAEPFRVPVDWKALGLYDYPQIIKKPMDLGTVKKRIADRKYKSVTVAAEDVRMVWKNCMTYNADGSDFFNLAKSLNKKWEEKFQKFLHDNPNLLPGGSSEPAVSSSTLSSGALAGSTPSGAIPSGGGGVDASSSTSSSKISLDDKKSFARSLYKISKEDLGKIIVEVDSKCPGALTKNAGEDECEFNVDKLSPSLFIELKQFIASCGGTPSATKKTKRQKS